VSFQFAYPAAFLLFVIPVVLFGWSRRKKWLFESAALVYSSTFLVENLPSTWRVRWRGVPAGLWAGAWVFLVVGLARPQSGMAQQITRGQGVDIVLALDISGSMNALDFAPQNRLEAAKAVIASFVAGRSFDRIGLVVFAADAFQRVPLTLDYNALLASLNAIELAPALALPDGTAIGMGVASSGNLLRPSRAASKVIILLTDGANNAGSIGPLSAAQAVGALGMRVYTISMGRNGQVQVPDVNGGTKLVESNLDENTLQKIASETGGQFFRAAELVDLQAVYNEINRLERSDIERISWVDWNELAPALVWIALGLFIMERLLRVTVFQVVP
jgi:Ca-activated chloride channel family protein